MSRATTDAIDALFPEDTEAEDVPASEPVEASKPAAAPPKPRAPAKPQASTTSVPTASTTKRTPTEAEIVAKAPRPKAPAPKGPPRAGGGVEAALAGAKKLAETAGPKTTAAVEKASDEARRALADNAAVGDAVKTTANIVVPKGLQESVTKKAPAPERESGPGVREFVREVGRYVGAKAGESTREALGPLFKADGPLFKADGPTPEQEAAERAAGMQRIAQGAAQKAVEVKPPDADGGAEALAKDIFGEKPLTSAEVAAGDKDHQKKVAKFRRERKGQLLRQWGYYEETPSTGDDAKDAAALQAKNDLVRQADEQVNADLSRLAQLGAAPPVLREVPEVVKSVPGGETAFRAARAVLPQSERVHGGGAVRSESLGWWALGTLSIPEYLIAAKLDPKRDWEQSIQNRTDLPTLYIERNPDVQAALTSGDGARVTQALGKVAPIMAMSILIPDPTEITSLASGGAAKTVDIARVSSKLAKEMSAAHKAGVPMERILKSVSWQDTIRKLAEETKAADAVKFQEGFAEVEKSFADARGDVEVAAQDIETRYPEVAREVRDRTIARMTDSDPDVAAYLEDTKQTQIDKGFPKDWVEPTVDDFAGKRADIDAKLEDVRGRKKATLDARAKQRAEAGRNATPGEDKIGTRMLDAEERTLVEQRKALDRQEAVLRGYTKVEDAYRKAGAEAVEDLRAMSRGDAPIERPKVETPRPTGPDEVDVRRVLGEVDDAPRARGLATAAEKGVADFVRQMGRLSDTAQDTLARRILAGASDAWKVPAGVRPYEHLRNVLRFDKARAGTKVAQIRILAEKAQARATKLAQQAALLRAGPENAAKIRETRATLAAAEKAYADANRALEKALGQSTTVLDEPPAVTKAKAQVEKYRGALNALRAQAGQAEVPADPVDGIRAMQRQKRFYTPAERLFSMTGEPYTLKDVTRKEGPHVSEIPIQDQDKAWALAKRRFAYNMERYSWAGADVGDEAQNALVNAGTIVANNQRGLPMWGETHPTPGALWNGVEPSEAFDTWYAAVENARVDGLPEAGSWNMFWRTYLPYSDTAHLAHPRATPLDPDVIRFNDTVVVRDPELAKRVNATHAKHGASPDDPTFIAVVVGFEKGPDGTPRVRLRPEYTVGGTPRRRVESAWNTETVSVDPSTLRYAERGRIYVDTVSTPKIKDLGRMMSPDAWAKVWDAETKDVSGLARTLRYGPDSVFVRTNPPRMPSRTDFYLPTDEIEEYVVEASTRGMKPPKGTDTVAPKPPRPEVLKRAEEKYQEAAAALEAVQAAEQEKARGLVAAYEAAKQRAADAEAALVTARRTHTETAAQVGKVSTPLQQTRLPEIEAKAAQAEAEAQQLSRAAAELDALVSSSDDTLRALDEALRGEVDGLRAVADALDEATAATKADTKVARGKVVTDNPPRWQTPEMLARILKLTKDGNAAAGRSTARAFGKHLLDGLRAAFVPAHKTLAESLNDATVLVLDRMDGALAKMEATLGRAVDDAKPKVRDSNARAMEVLDEHVFGFQRAFRAKQTPRTLLVLASTAFLKPSAGLDKANADALLKVLVAWADEGSGDVAKLREALLKESETIAKNRGRPDILQHPQHGDIYLAQALARVAIQHEVIRELAGVGVAVNKADAMAANDWLAHNPNSARGREVVARMMADPLKYRGDFSTMMQRTEQGMSVAHAEPVVPLAGGESTSAKGLVNWMAQREFEGKLAEVLAAQEALDAQSLYVPRAVRDRLAASIDAAVATYTTPNAVGISDVLTNYWKQALTVGVLFLSPRYFFNNKWGDFDQAATTAGIVPALKMTYQSLLAEVMAVSGVAQAARALDALKREEPGTNIRRLDHALASISVGGSGGGVTRIMEGKADDLIRIGGKTYRASELYRRCLDGGVFETFVTGELTRSVAQAMTESVLGKAGRYVTQYERALRDTSNLIATRRRVGLFYALVEQGKTPEQAAEMVKAALYDYSHTLHPFERGLIFQVLAPFWTFEKNNFYRTWNAFTRPGMWGARITPGYRMKMVHKSKEYGAQVLSWYFDSSDEYGYDRNSMMEEPDPTARVERYDFYTSPEGGALSHTEAMEKVAEEFEAGLIPPAYERYARVLAEMDAKGLSYEEKKRALAGAGAPGLENMRAYYAPDPTREMLPPWAQNRYAVWLDNRRSQRLASEVFSGVGAREKDGDSQRLIAVVEDANGTALGKVAATAALVVALGRAANADVAAMSAASEAAGQMVSSPQESMPLVVAGLAAFGAIPNARDEKLDPYTGAVLKEILPSYVNAEQVQARGEDPGQPEATKWKTTYSIDPEAAAWTQLMGGATKFLLVTREFNELRHDVEEGNWSEVLIGQKVYKPSAAAEGDRARREVGARLDAFTANESFAESRPAPLSQEEKVRRMQADILQGKSAAEAAQALGTNLSAVPQRAVTAYRRGGPTAVRDNDLVLLRKMLEERGVEGVVDMKDAQVIDVAAEVFNVRGEGVATSP